jgi:flavin reductase (DIM6/NTAB) family NADH-FMN oxidoreductase RutF
MAFTEKRTSGETMNVQDRARHLRACFGKFATGVTVVTYRAGEEVCGVTMNSFTSVSLDPPLILLSVAKTARTSDALDRTDFAVNVLRVDQMDLALHFAGRPHPGALIKWGEAENTRLPFLEDALAVFQCQHWRRYDGGDHVLHLGEVVSSTMGEGEPLLFVAGRFSSVGLPILDGPLVTDLDGPAVPAWVGALHRVHRVMDHP